MKNKCFLNKQLEMEIHLSDRALCSLNTFSLLYFCSLVLMAEVQLDSLKQKGAIKRTLFLDNHQAHRVFPLVIKGQKSHQCQDFIVYLRVSMPERLLWPLTFISEFQPFFSI